MKTVGFIDYFLHEWHANEYPAMIAAYNEKNGTDYQVKYAWAEIDSPNEGARTTDEWCKVCASGLLLPFVSAHPRPAFRSEAR